MIARRVGIGTVGAGTEPLPVQPAGESCAVAGPETDGQDALRLSLVDESLTAVPAVVCRTAP